MRIQKAMMILFKIMLVIGGFCQFGARVSGRANVAEPPALQQKELLDSSKLLKRLLRPRKYDNKTRPMPPGKPVIVKISMGIESFSEIRESNMEFQVFIYLRQEWTDPRLAHKKNGTLALKADDVKRIWVPDTYFNNAKDFEIFKTAQLAVIFGDGGVYFSTRMRVKAACEMNLKSFPMDVQKCSLITESFAYDANMIDFRWGKGDNSITIFNDMMAEFDVVNVDFAEKNASYVSGTYKDLIVSFTFRRRMGFYFIQYYIPSIVMVLLSWISFWMDQHYIGERISLGITTVLTIVFLLSSSNSAMPRVSYAKAIDWYLLVSFLFVFSTLVTDLGIYRLRTTHEEKDGDRKNRRNKEDAKVVFKCKHNLRPQYVADNTGRIHVVSSYEDNRRLSDSIMASVCCMPGMSRRNEPGRAGRNLGQTLNKVCRYLYPLSFGFFNLVYWLALELA